jgi:predicted GIY-YIG superfamily endonuclease
MSSLKTYFTAKYGAEIYKETKELQQAKTNMAKSKNQYIFLQKCIKHKLIPKSLRIVCPINNKRGKEITKRYRFELLICIKNDSRSRYFNQIKLVKDIENCLYKNLTEEDYESVKNITEKSREKMFVISKNRLIKKFKILQNINPKEKPKTPSFLKDVVLNLCETEIPENHRNLLELGPKFVPTIKNVPYLDIISITESSALKLEYSNKIESSQDLRRNVLRQLKMFKPQKNCNLNRDQIQALKQIKEDKNIDIYPFDKGAGFVRIEHNKAIEKIRHEIGRTNIIKEDPTIKFASKIRTYLSKLNKKGRFTKKEYESLYPSDPIPPRMYGVIKAHKPEKSYPMRLVVSTIGTPSYGISQYLVNIFQPILNKNITMLKNSSTFVKTAKLWNISNEEIQVSYDVVNLYPSIPLREATKILLDMLEIFPNLDKLTKLSISEIKSLIELCLSKCYFLWNEEIHELVDSGPIGLSLMVILAEGFLQFFENKAINIALYSNPPLELKSFLRYVDDSHARFTNKDNAIRFQKILNSQHQAIKYTIELEDDSKTLNFLDIQITNNKTGNYDFNVHRKDALTNVQVKYNSNHDPKILDGIFKGFIHRALFICSEKFVQKEIDFLISVFAENGYEEKKLKNLANNVTKKPHPNNKIIPSNNQIAMPTISLPWIPVLSPKLRKIFRKAGYKTVFKSNANLKSLLTSRNKTKLQSNSHPGVYLIECECKQGYVGETKMKVSTRMKQHQKNVLEEKWEQSAIGYHKNKCPCNIKWEQTTTLKVEPKKFERKVRESIEIQYNKCGPKNGGMNLDDGQFVKTQFWTPYFLYLRNQKEVLLKRTLKKPFKSDVNVCL